MLAAAAKIAKTTGKEKRGTGHKGRKKATAIAKVRGFYLEYRAERRLSTYDKRSASNYYYLNATF